MKRMLFLSSKTSILVAMLLLVSPLVVLADDATIQVETDIVTATGLIISEVQTGKATRVDEYIELFNATDEPIDLTGWQLRYITASESSKKTVEDPSSVIAMAPPLVGEAATLLPPNSYYLLYSGTTALPEGVLGQSYEGMLPATGGSMVLVRPNDQSCEFEVMDALAWGATTHLFGEGEALVSGMSSAKDRLFQRYVDSVGAYVDGGGNSKDFLASEAIAASSSTPGVSGSPLLPITPIPGSGSTSFEYPREFVNPGCSLPDPPDQPPTEPPESPPSAPPEDDEEGDDPTPIIPAANAGLRSPQLSEFLPNPGSPLTDANDEFIELYNPNDKRFDLSGYVLEVGLTSKRRYTMPFGTFIEPRAFRAFFSADTRLALSNNGSQVGFVDPVGTLLLRSEAYSTAKDGQAWVFANGKWQWTTKPTPNALNTVSTPVVKAVSTAKSKKSASKASTSTGTTFRSGDVSDGKPGATDAAVLAVNTRTPLHPSVLALIGASAVLYGAYEYRRDVANRIHEFRSNRAARAALRRSTEGR